MQNEARRRQVIDKERYPFICCHSRLGSAGLICLTPRAGCQAVSTQYSSFGIEFFAKPPHIDGEFDFEPFRRAEAIANVDMLDFKGSLAGTHHYVDTIPCEWIRTLRRLGPVKRKRGICNHVRGSIDLYSSIGDRFLY